MTDREPINTPSLAGWAIAAAVAVVGFAISYLVVGLGVMGSALIAVILLLAVGIILDMSARTSAAPAARQDARSADPVASSPAAPAAPAPVASAPAARVETTPEPATPAPVAAAELPADSVAPSVAPARPQGLDAARDGQPDDLKRIKGVGPALEGLLNRLGYFHFDQIAAWTPEQISWVDQNLEGFKGRVTRDDWVAQARVLAAGGDTEFSARAK